MRGFTLNGYALLYLKTSFFYFFFLGALGVLLIAVGFLAGQKRRFEWSKLMAFECGFDSLSSTRDPFSLRFFLLALLFLIFDVEIILLFPYIFNLKISCFKIRVVRKCLYFRLLVILVGGLAHELNEGTLDWKYD